MKIESGGPRRLDFRAFGSLPVDVYFSIDFWSARDTSKIDFWAALGGGEPPSGSPCARSILNSFYFDQFLENYAF